LTPVAPGTPVGDFDFVAVGVPWPASLAMFSAALVVLGLGSLRTTFRRSGSGDEYP